MQLFDLSFLSTHIAWAGFMVEFAALGRASKSGVHGTR
jgi:hypothetical protein